MYLSDGLGCDYGNNWNSAHYGNTIMSNIPISIRSATDSYIAASAYTRSCSNDYLTAHDCFGLTHIEEKMWCIWWIAISVVLLVLEILVCVLFL